MLEHFAATFGVAKAQKLSARKYIGDKGWRRVVHRSKGLCRHDLLIVAKDAAFVPNRSNDLPGALLALGSGCGEIKESPIDERAVADVDVEGLYVFNNCNAVDVAAYGPLGEKRILQEYRVHVECEHTETQIIDSKGHIHPPIGKPPVVFVDGVVESRSLCKKRVCVSEQKRMGV